MTENTARTAAPLKALGLGIAALLLGVSGCNSKPATARDFAHGALEKLEVRANPPGAPADPFEDPIGKRRTLADWRGKVVVMNLWATWCEPCRKEMPTLASLAEAYRGKDLVVLPISVDKMSDRDLAKATLSELAGDKLELYQAPNYDIAFDVDGAVFPTTIIYDRAGKEVARLAGGADWSSPEARGLMDYALARK